MGQKRAQELVAEDGCGDAMSAARQLKSFFGPRKVASP